MALPYRKKGSDLLALLIVIGLAFPMTEEALGDIVYTLVTTLFLGLFQNRRW